MTGNLRELIARCLYEREKARGEHAKSVIDRLGGKGDTLALEPWDECKDTFLGDADAVIKVIEEQ